MLRIVFVDFPPLLFREYTHLSIVLLHYALHVLSSRSVDMFPPATAGGHQNTLLIEVVDEC